MHNSGQLTQVGMPHNEPNDESLATQKPEREEVWVYGDTEGRALCVGVGVCGRWGAYACRIFGRVRVCACRGMGARCVWAWACGAWVYGVCGRVRVWATAASEAWS